MINIRLQRRGRKNDPSFRVIVVDSKKKPKTGSYLEMVGSYDPRVDRIELKAERILAWMKEGAKPSDTVHNLLVSQKIIDAKKINVLPRKTVPKKEEVPTAPTGGDEAVKAEEQTDSTPQRDAEGSSEKENASGSEATPAPVSTEVAEEKPAE